MPRHCEESNPMLSDPLRCSEPGWGLLPDQCQSSRCDDNDDFPDLVHSNDEGELSALFSKERLIHEVWVDPSLAKPRREAVEWMLAVTSHYSFSTLTAVLAVNYLDRFLSGVHFRRDKPWMLQLASVACLSLAAKMEETQVPLLLDLQVEQSRYVFEAKTIQRMEILVLSTLQWMMNPVTPLSFLHYITSRLGLKRRLGWEFLRRCERVLLSLISDSRYTLYLPSVMATAITLHVVSGIEPRLGVEYGTHLLGILGIDKDKVDDCSKLVSEVESGHGFNKRKYGSVPGSPNGVMDVSFSWDGSNEASSASSSPEPLSKKSRGTAPEGVVRATADVASITR